MVDDTFPYIRPELEPVHKALASDGFAVTSDWAIGLRENFSTYLKDVYFDQGQLRHDEGDMPADRKRARDVVYYEWHDGRLTLSEYETIGICDRSGIKGERIHKRINMLEDLPTREMVSTFISLVPPERRQARGTFGINLFRTHTDVVSRPHRDEEQFILLYVLDRHGEGAESYLYEEEPEAGQPAKPVLYRQLNPGELMIFEDQRFLHGAEPIIAPADGNPRRDVLVCTIDYPTSYLERGRILSHPAADGPCVK
jgi:hypothetical protein